ncbi:hypothetical protein BC937DRAFT_95089 [Endogone sp. FLAS-F59071]|nr:hypothetical protein BC937DRAFT_95089 [Endogone sp. FLAS-F59071]|eukprot:RUS13587.1 hypothetical protein BC937DRAFT_95089 [Endogone sp. FLAS-F59071]
MSYTDRQAIFGLRERACHVRSTVGAGELVKGHTDNLVLGEAEEIGAGRGRVQVEAVARNLGPKLNFVQGVLGNALGPGSRCCVHDILPDQAIDGTFAAR